MHITNDSEKNRHSRRQPTAYDGEHETEKNQLDGENV